jgi:hypothetical protein
MIRHADLPTALAVLSLAIAMIESPFQALLVPAIGGTSLTEPRPLSAYGAAITLTAVTIRAEEE